MKKILLTGALLMIGAGSIFAQTYMTRTGRIFFNATTPTSPEKIEAVNNETGSLVDAKTGSVRFQVLIKSFKFASELMQEHFNENYMESDKYPKSDFAGTITNISEINFTKDGTYKAVVSGKLTIHGISKDVTETGSIVVKGNSATLKAKFAVLLKDYKVEIPSLVADKVAKEAALSIDCELTKK